MTVRWQEGELLDKSEYDARYPDKVSDYTAAYRQTSDGQMKFIDAASTQTIGDLPSGNEAGAFVTMVVVVVAADDDDDVDARDAHTALQ